MSNDKKPQEKAQKQTDVASPKGKFVKVTQADREIINFDAWEENGLGEVKEVTDKKGKKTKAFFSDWIQGMPIDIVELSKGDEDKGPWTCMVLRLTEPISNVNQDGDVYEVPSGTDVLLTTHFELNDFCSFATHPTDIWEVRLRTAGKRKTKKGFEVQKYEKEQTPNPVAKRSDVCPSTIAKLSAAAAARAALPPAPFE